MRPELMMRHQRGKNGSAFLLMLPACVLTISPPKLAAAAGTLEPPKVTSAPRRATPNDYWDAEVHISQFQVVGNGDADVFSKPGRTTTITIHAEAPTVTPNKKECTVTGEMEIHEDAPDNTTLRGYFSITYTAPEGRWIAACGRTATKSLEYSRRIRGENHKWNTVTGLAGTVFKRLAFRFDGNGDDDRGNAKLSGRIRVPILLTDEAPTEM